MGILLRFMFIWNMVGVLGLIPVLSHLLLRPCVLGALSVHANQNLWWGAMPYR